jgi:hypothetical protein
MKSPLALVLLVTDVPIKDIIVLALTALFTGIPAILSSGGRGGVTRSVW